MKHHSHSASQNVSKIKNLVTIKLMLLVVLSAALTFFLPAASASLGTFKINDCVPIRVLANCSSINLTEVTVNNLNSFQINKQMTRLGGQTFNYTFCNTSQQGIYTYSWDNPCVDCSQGDCGNSFEVTATGSDMTTAKSVTYIIIFVISILIFIFLLMGGIYLPSKNHSNEMTGYIIAVNNLKYLKLVLLGLAYVTALFVSYFAWMLSLAYLDMNFMNSIFQFIFYFLAIATLPIFILFCYILIANGVRDTKISEMLRRGLSVRE